MSTLRNVHTLYFPEFLAKSRKPPLRTRPRAAWEPWPPHPDNRGWGLARMLQWGELERKCARACGRANILGRDGSQGAELEEKL